MSNSTLGWLLLTLFCIIIQALYSMLEMAAVSFNRVRLEYYVHKGVKRAIWLEFLLKEPSRIFATIMLGVNIALQIGSESSREFYLSLHLDPDIAPLTQVFLVVIFAELVPLFAARKYAEHVIMLGMPLLYATYRLFSPLIWLMGLLMRLIIRCFGTKEETINAFLTREELQKTLESHEEDVKEGNEFNLIVSNIFSLRNKKAHQIMTPLNKLETIWSNASVQEFRAKIAQTHLSYLPVFHKTHSNIIAIAFAKEMVRLSDNKNIRDYARPPWFIPKDTHIIQILHQFRRNNQSVAVVLDDNGFTIGMLTLDALLEEIFGELSHTEDTHIVYYPLIERTFPGNMSIEEFNTEFQVNLEAMGAETLAQLMITKLQHMPEEGESVLVGPFEFTAEETTLLGIKSITVKSIE